MHIFKHKTLNQRGFHHYAILGAAFVLLFAILGSYFYITGKAAAIPELESSMTINGVHYCLDDHADGGPGSHIDGWACNGSAAQRFSYSNGLLYIGSSCVGVSGASANTIGRYLVIASQCSPTPWGGAWTKSGNMFLNNHADASNPNYNKNHTLYCLDIAGAAADGWVDVWPCNGGSNQSWTENTYNSSTGGGTTGGTAGGYGAEFVARAKLWDGLAYNYGGGIHKIGYSGVIDDCENGRQGTTPVINSACDTDCSGFVSMVVDDVLDKNYVWTVGPSSSGTGIPGYMSGGSWVKLASVNDAQPGDIVTRSNGSGHVGLSIRGLAIVC